MLGKCRRVVLMLVRMKIWQCFVSCVRKPEFAILTLKFSKKAMVIFIIICPTGYKKNSGAENILDKSRDGIWRGLFLMIQRLMLQLPIRNFPIGNGLKKTKSPMSLLVSSVSFTLISSRNFPNFYEIRN